MDSPKYPLPLSSMSLPIGDPFGSPLPFDSSACPSWAQTILVPVPDPLGSLSTRLSPGQARSIGFSLGLKVQRLGRYTKPFKQKLRGGEVSGMR